MALAIGFVAILAAYAGNTQFLTPGPMTAAHSALSNCGVCHSNVAEGKFGWLHTIFEETDPKKSSSACLSCHNMENSALNPHGLALDELERRTAVRRQASAMQIAPMSLRVRDAVFSTEETASSQVFCTTCHKEHQGERFPITSVTNDQCQSCHAVQFSSFEDGHPDAGTYPFDRRTRINFDHTKHFKIHFPETAKKVTGKVSQPDACGDCHVPGPENRLMVVQPFAQMCSSCHLGQILGVEGATEARGISLFSLPGLDLASLREMGAQIGEWPEDAYALETEMSPLLRLFIGSDAKGRELLARVEALSLVELEEASAQDIKAVEQFAWQVKELIYAFSTAKISESELVKTFTAELNLQSVDQQLLTELTASIPLDVWTSAQREWLPNLAQEIALYRNGQPVPMPSPPAPAPAAEEPAEKAAVPDDGSDILGEEDADVSEGGDILGEEETGEGDDLGLLTEEVDEPTADESNQADTTPQAVSPEEWAEFGGWYRQDFEIRYKPTRHSDQFVRSWLDFTGVLMGLPQKPLAEPVVNLLTKKGAPGQCAKCHSIDQNETGALSVKWGPESAIDQVSGFTRFSHEPHFSIKDERGCLTCHDLNTKADYAASYKSYDPKVFQSNFKPIEQNFCRECHTATASGDDCQLCHAYHVTDIDTRNMAHTTKSEAPSDEEPPASSEPAE